MTLIKSISGIRGTIGGKPGDNLTPPDIVRFTAAFGKHILKAKSNSGKPGNRLVVGRDARVSGELVSSLVCSTLSAMGFSVLDIGLSTTPTVEMAVRHYAAMGGIIITASHNPAEWNALKLLNEEGEFLNALSGEEILEIADSGDFEFSPFDALGMVSKTGSFIEEHVKAILEYPLVDVKAIREAGLTVVVDPVNSVGAIAVPALLEALGLQRVICINSEPNGLFAHNPEPLPEHLGQIAEAIRDSKANLGIVVDPDVDRLALVCEDGSPFGEEYTLVAVADYFLKYRPGPVVSNLSSSRALKDVAASYGQVYHASAVGEVNVVAMMKAVGAVIGGEGNGGIIVPDFHYGRDALIGIALFLSHLVQQGMRASELRQKYPDYAMDKQKVTLDAGISVDEMLQRFIGKHMGMEMNTADGVRIDSADHWVHIRKSNTEPIVRIYVEAIDTESAKKYSKYWREQLLNCI